MPALVSIAIPCFNSASWIGAAIESALAQDWPDKEVIVVDDGSTDGSLEQVRAFGERVKVLTGGHRGSNPARNLALHAATGEWVQFLDADDFLEPRKLSYQLSADAARTADVLYSPVWVDTTSGGVTSRESTQIDPALDLFAQWITWQLPQTGGALWRRRTLLGLGGWKETQPCCQEHELYLRALQAGRTFHFLPEPHAVYRVWSDTTLSTRAPQAVITAKTALLENLRDWLRARGRWTGEYQRLTGRACFEMARTLARYNLAEAAAYHRRQRAAGLIHLSGPAAPRAYRLAYTLGGFRFAETIARKRRTPHRSS